MAKLSKNQKCLFLIHLLRGIMELFTNTFLTSHIITSITSDNVLGAGLFNSAIFYISQYVFYAVVYVLASFFVKRYNRAIFLQLSIFVNLGLIIGLVFWGDAISGWIVLVGALCGLSNALYYAAYFVMKNELAHRRTMKHYNILTVIGVNIIKIVMPTILGFLIDASTYSYIAIYMIFIAVAQFVISFFITTSKAVYSKLQLSKYLKELRQDPEAKSKIKYTYINAIFSGIKNTYKLIVIVLTVYTLKTNLGLGIFTSITSVVVLGMLIGFKFLDNKKNVNKFSIYFIIGILPLITCFGIVFYLEQITLIIFNFFLNVAIYFSDYFGSSERDAIIKHIGKREYIAEHQLLIEIITCISRVAAYGVMLLVGFLENIDIFKVLLVVFMILSFVKYMVMYKQRQIRKDYEIKNKESLNENNDDEKKPAV